MKENAGLMLSYLSISVGYSPTMPSVGVKRSMLAVDIDLSLTFYCPSQAAQEAVLHLFFGVM
jgi:hypothetical protein